MSRTPLIAGNWKMHKTVVEAERFVQALLPRVAGFEDVQIAVCPPATALSAVVDSTRGSGVEIFAQNAYDADEGAFTGEISAAMLADLEVAGAIVGHSERRQLFGETDSALARKLPALLNHGLTPILCVGETEEERDAGDMEKRLRSQVQADLADVARDRLSELVIAYEPIWAIGTGRTATPEQAQEACAFVRALVAGFSADAAESVRVLYGGSVKPDNAAELLALPDLDGALVGGASLDPDSFAAIVAAARK